MFEKSLTICLIFFTKANKSQSCGFKIDTNQRNQNAKHSAASKVITVLMYSNTQFTW